MGLWQGWEPRVEEGRLGRRPHATSHSYNLISPLSCLTIRWYSLHIYTEIAMHWNFFKEKYQVSSCVEDKEDCAASSEAMIQVNNCQEAFQRNNLSPADPLRPQSQIWALMCWLAKKEMLRSIQRGWKTNKPLYWQTFTITSIQLKASTPIMFIEKKNSK